MILLEYFLFIVISVYTCEVIYGNVYFKLFILVFGRYRRSSFENDEPGTFHNNHMPYFAQFDVNDITIWIGLEIK